MLTNEEKVIILAAKGHFKQDAHQALKTLVYACEPEILTKVQYFRNLYFKARGTKNPSTVLRIVSEIERDIQVWMHVGKLLSEAREDYEQILAQKWASRLQLLQVRDGDEVLIDLTLPDDYKAEVIAKLGKKDD